MKARPGRQPLVIRRALRKIGAADARRSYVGLVPYSGRTRRPAACARSSIHSGTTRLTAVQVSAKGGEKDKLIFQELVPAIRLPDIQVVLRPVRPRPAWGVDSDVASTAASASWPLTVLRIVGLRSLTS